MSKRKKKAIYAGIFLDEESAEKLRSTSYLYKEFCHHCTIAFKPTAEQVKALPMGEEVFLRTIRHGCDQKAQAVMVKTADVDSYLFPAGQKPHITISCAEGISPVHSNELDFEEEIPAANQMILRGRVGIFTGKDIQYTLEGTIYEEVES